MEFRAIYQLRIYHVNVHERTLTWMVRSGLVVAVAGFVWMAWPSQGEDRWFNPVVEQPAFTKRPWPRVLIDEAHLNMHTASGRYRPLARLLERDGFRVLPSEGRITPSLLRGCEIFVTANALGYRGLLQHAVNLAGLERAVDVGADAFTDAEARTLADWVASGGRALIVADHAPAGLASRRLAAAFGVEMTNWWAEDRGSAEITFTHANGGLTDHPITHGIETVVTFTGQALKAPPSAASILRLSGDGREYPYRGSTEKEGRSAAGLAQAVALEYGRGRVVVLGEAAAITAQRMESPGAQPLTIGMNRAGSGNRLFALNIVHWLIGLL